MTGAEDYPKIPQPVPPLPLPEFAYKHLDKQERIGTGGDANVYRATLKHDGYTYSVAIKEPRFEGTIQKRTIEKFQNEAETWAGLNDHDNIVSVYAWGSQPVPWLALEHMDGGTLETRIGEADITEALWLSGRIAEGIRYGHRHGIAHLDIKPTNILLRETGSDTWNYPKVSDWGLAKLLLEHSNSIEAISPTYAAPEQFDAEEFGSPDDITDIYQLGTVVYALIAGEPPFGGSSTAVMRSVLDDEPRPPSEINSEVPDQVDEIVLKALAKRKVDRYEGILPFRNALDELFVEVADAKITSETTEQASTGRRESITPAAARSDSDSGGDTEHSKVTTAKSSGDSSSDTQSTGDTGPLTRRRALSLLGLGLGGAGGFLAMNQTGGNDPVQIGDTNRVQTGGDNDTSSDVQTAPETETQTARETQSQVEWDYYEDFEQYSVGRFLEDIRGWKENLRSKGVHFEIEEASADMYGQKALGTSVDDGLFKVGGKNSEIDDWTYPARGFEMKAVLYTGGETCQPQAGILFVESESGNEFNLSIEIDNAPYNGVGIKYANSDGREVIGEIESESYEIRMIGTTDQEIQLSYRKPSEESWSTTTRQVNFSGEIQGFFLQTNNGGQIDHLRLRQR